MINPEIEKFIMENLEDLIISSDNVANIIDTHSLMHGLIVLSNERYTTIPVLSIDSKLLGLINSSKIISECMSAEDWNFDLLNSKRINEIDLLEPFIFYRDSSLEYILQELIHANFLSLIDQDGQFLGILTRRTILSKINQLFHSSRLSLGQEEA